MTIPADIVNDHSIRRHTERSLTGALIAQWTRLPDPRDKKHEYYGAWVDTTEEQRAIDKSKKTPAAQTEAKPAKSTKSKTVVVIADELAEAEALLAKLTAQGGK